MTYQINGNQQKLYAFSTHGVTLSVPTCLASLLSAHEVNRTDFFFLNSYIEQKRSS